jgi:hypothetical protein
MKNSKKPTDILKFLNKQGNDDIYAESPLSSALTRKKKFCRDIN